MTRAPPHTVSYIMSLTRLDVEGAGVHHNVAGRQGRLEGVHVRLGRAGQGDARQRHVGGAVDVQVHQPGVRGVDEALRAVARLQGVREYHRTREVQVEIEVQDVVDQLQANVGRSSTGGF